MPVTDQQVQQLQSLVNKLVTDKGDEDAKTGTAAQSAAAATAAVAQANSDAQAVTQAEAVTSADLDAIKEFVNSLSTPA
jgi:hypothetical protein